jgi:hypothetical protein|tara:strand:+ start:853 stop:1266 length:414 start_codon:yes stop_codon:yes gene_type:complete
MITSDFAQCPECKYLEANYELDFGRRSEILFCPRCGFNCRNITIIDGKTGHYKIRKDGRFIERSYMEKAYGAFRLQHTESHSSLGSVLEPLTHELIDEFWSKIEGSEISEKKSYLTSWNSETHFGEIIIGSVKMIRF